MSHRDQHRSAQYFIEYVEQVKAVLSTIDGQSGAEAQVQVLLKRLNLVSANYSMGADRQKIGEMVRELFEEVPDALAARPLSLGDAIPFVALGYLFDIEDPLETIHGYMVSPIDHSTRNRIIDLLLGDESAWNSDGYPGRGQPETVSKYFWAVADAGRAGSPTASELLVSFVRTHWYRGWKAAPWWGAHRNTVHKVYSGYWCFEGAALAKMFDLDDSALQAHKYYPYDLVHGSTPAPALLTSPLSE